MEHDWEDHRERHGLLVMHKQVSSTVAELRAASFFVTAFAVSDVAAGTKED